MFEKRLSNDCFLVSWKWTVARWTSEPHSSPLLQLFYPYCKFDCVLVVKIALRSAPLLSINTCMDIHQDEWKGDLEEDRQDLYLWSKRSFLVEKFIQRDTLCSSVDKLGRGKSGGLEFSVLIWFASLRRHWKPHLGLPIGKPTLCSPTGFPKTFLITDWYVLLYLPECA